MRQNSNATVAKPVGSLPANLDDMKVKVHLAITSNTAESLVDIQ